MKQLLNSSQPAHVDWRENINLTVAPYIDQNSDLIFHGKARTEWPMVKQIIGRLMDPHTETLRRQWSHNRKS